MKKPTVQGQEPSREDLLEKLKLEHTVAVSGGYGAPAGSPRESLTPFRDSVSCLNFGRKEGEPLEPCDRCWLMNFVPHEQQSQPFPCHHILLNEKGETVASLGATGDHDRLQEALVGWLHRNIVKLES